MKIVEKAIKRQFFLESNKYNPAQEANHAIHNQIGIVQHLKISLNLKVEKSTHC